DDLDFRVALTKPIYASDPLLDTHRIPRHVVVYERATELEVQPLRRRIGAHQHVRATLFESALHFVAGDESPQARRISDLATAAREAHDRIAPISKKITQIVHCIGEL